MIRLATIGTSSIVTVTAAAARVVEGLTVSAVYSRDRDRAAAFAAGLGVAASFHDLDALLASPEVDAVYIASPNGLHAAQARAALAAGKHVFTEKPCVATVAEFDELVAVARQNGVVYTENMRTAHDPVMLRVVELIPTLGPVRRVSFSLSQRSARYEAVLRGERPAMFDPELGGGALADLGVYCTHPLVRLFGSPERVTSALIPVPTGVDGAGGALASYPGMVAEIWWSKMTGGDTAGTIEGEAGTLTVDHIADLNEVVVEYADGRRLVERPVKEEYNISYALRRFVELVGGAPATDDLAWSRASVGLIARIRAAADLG